MEPDFDALRVREDFPKPFAEVEAGAEQVPEAAGRLGRSGDGRDIRWRGRHESDHERFRPSPPFARPGRPPPASFPTETTAARPRRTTSDPRVNAAPAP